MEMTDNNNNTTNPLHLEQPLIAAANNSHNNNGDGSINRRNNHLGGGGISGGGRYNNGPRILDRDGTFAQSRGRWSVSNTRQRRNTNNNNVVVANDDDDNDDNNGGGGRTSAFFSPTSSRRKRRTTNSSSSSSLSLFSRLCNRLACCNSYFGQQQYYSQNQQNQNQYSSSLSSFNPRRCWDDWFHTLSYTPTCILMLGVFIAYFVTIVIFAGLYLMVNKVGEHYNPAAADGGSDGSGGGGNPPKDYNDLTTETLAAVVTGVEGGGGENVISMVDVGVGSSFCGMDINNHMEALYFSLSTMATIGYGTSDYYFGECWTPFLLVLLQVFSAIAFSSLAIGLLFQRMSRGQKRSRTIVFSDVAIIRMVRGKWYWMFRVAELRKQHIIGAKIRVFCVRHERCPLNEDGGGEGEDASAAAVVRGGGGSGGGRNTVVELETAHFVSHPLPLLTAGCGSQGDGAVNIGHSNNSSSNNDCSFEQSILMGLPHVVVHRLDSTSPMLPPRPIWYDESGVPHGPVLSLSESSTSGGTATAESSGSLLATVEEGTALSMHESRQSMPSSEEITHFLQDRQAEIIIYLEGTCEVTGMALQARHSYRVEDIAFHHTFAPCVFPTSSADGKGKKNRWNPFSRSAANKHDHNDDFNSRDAAGWEEGIGDNNCALEIDFDQFHDLIPAPYDCSSCPYVPVRR